MVTMYKLPVIVHNGVDSVRNRQHRAVSKLSPYRWLDEVVGLRVYGRRRLIKDQHFSLAQQRTSQAHQLLLTNAAQRNPTCMLH